MNSLVDLNSLTILSPKPDKLRFKITRDRHRFTGKKDNFLNEYENIKKHLRLKKHNEITDYSNKVVIDSDSARIEISGNEIKFCLHGYYFEELFCYNSNINIHKRFNEIRAFIEYLQHRYRTICTPLQVDIAVDILQKNDSSFGLENILPFPSNTVYWDFLERRKKDWQTYKWNNSDIYTTGITVSTKTTTILYRKDLNIKKGNEKKVKLPIYRKRYNLNKFPNRIVVRMETRLKQEFSIYFFKKMLNGEDIFQVSKDTLTEFYTGKNIKVKPEHSKDNKKNRWKPCLNFKQLTFTEEESEKSLLTEFSFNKRDVRYNRDDLISFSQKANNFIENALKKGISKSEILKYLTISLDTKEDKRTELGEVDLKNKRQVMNTHLFFNSKAIQIKIHSFAKRNMTQLKRDIFSFSRDKKIIIVDENPRRVSRLLSAQEISHERNSFNTEDKLNERILIMNNQKINLELDYKQRAMKSSDVIIFNSFSLETVKQINKITKKYKNKVIIINFIEDYILEQYRLYPKTRHLLAYFISKFKARYVSILRKCERQ